MRRTQLILVLLALLGIPGSTAALPTGVTEADEQGPSRTGAASNLSLWTEPAVSTPRAPGGAQAQPPRPEPAPSANPLWAIPLAALSNTRERPIFSASRRSPAPAVAAAPAPRALPPPPKPPRIERPQLSLVGTIVGGDQSFGIFLDQASKAALRLRPGEEYQGWTLSSVHGREVVFERDRQSTTLALPQPAATAALGRAQAESSLVQEVDTQPDRRGDPRSVRRSRPASSDR